MAKIIGKIRNENELPSYSKLRQEYLNFYKNYKGPRDDFYDQFFESKRKDLPLVEVSRGSGWVVKGDGFEEFYPSASKEKEPTRFGKPIKGEKIWVQDYKEKEANPLQEKYASMIRDLQDEYLSEIQKEEKRKKISQEIKNPTSVLLQTILSERFKK